MNWTNLIYAAAALLIAYFMWRGCMGTRQMKRDARGKARRAASDLYDLKALEVKGYTPINAHELLTGAVDEGRWN